MVWPGLQAPHALRIASRSLFSLLTCSRMRQAVALSLRQLLAPALQVLDGLLDAAGGGGLLGLGLLQGIAPSTSCGALQHLLVELGALRGKSFVWRNCLTPVCAPSP